MKKDILLEKICSPVKRENTRRKSIRLKQSFVFNNGSISQIIYGYSECPANNPLITIGLN